MRRKTMTRKVNKDLTEAARTGDLQLATRLIDRHGLSYSDGYALLMTAIENNDTAIARLLLNRGCKVKRDSDTLEDTPLHSAARNGNIEIVKLLLDREAYNNDKNKKGETPLSISVEKGYWKIVNLLKPSADVDLTPLHSACREKDTKAVRSLLSNGADLNAKTDRGSTPLHFAARYGCSDVVNILLKRGARVDDEDNKGRTALYFAVARGDLPIVEAVLKYRPDANKENNKACLKTAVCADGGACEKIVTALLNYGFTVHPENAKDSQFFHSAVTKGNYTLANSLLKYGADANSVEGVEGFSPLHIAVKKKHEQVVKLLISSKANINTQDSKGRPPMFYAIENVDLKIVQLLLNHGSNVKDFPKLLHVAVRNNSIEIIELLLKYAVDVNACDEYGRTALHFTVFQECEGRSVIDSDFFAFRTEEDPNACKKLEIAEFLLRKGANIDAPTKSGVTTLHAAIKKGFYPMVDVLLAHNASVNSTDRDDVTPLHISTQRGNVEISIVLLNKGTDVNAKKNNGVTPLHLALTYGHKEVVKVLLENESIVDWFDIVPQHLAASRHNADINCADEEGVSPLHISSQKGNVEITTLLLDKGANVNAIKKDGDSPLHLAVANGHGEIVKLLLQLGANVNRKGLFGRSPLHWAAEKGYSGILDVLLKFGACVNSRCDDGRTALHFSSERGDADVVATLIDYGADFSIKCQRFYTPLKYAWEKVLAIDPSNSRYGTNGEFYHKKPIIIPHPYFDIVNILNRHRVKMDAAGVKYEGVCSSVYRITGLEDFHLKCQLEIVIMTSEFIRDTNVSYYDILKKDSRGLAKYMKNESLVHGSKSENYWSKFPMYASLIRNQFRNGLATKQFLDAATRILHRFTGLPEDCLEKVLDYLSDDDLIVLADV